MIVCTTIPDVRAACHNARASSTRPSLAPGLGLVPTMGALHEGHLSLVRAAKNRRRVVAASIFVNPTQFGPTEDFSKYPRQFDRDRRLLENEGVDILFAPAIDEIYPDPAVTWVVVEGLSDKLDGRSRPGHFRGVTTIVAKLFNIVEPDAAFFGQKDAAQLAIIQRMVQDLNFPVEIVACPIVREPDGLAMSSRNAYLNPARFTAFTAASAAAIRKRRNDCRKVNLRRQRSFRRRAASRARLFRDRPSRHARPRQTNNRKNFGSRRCPRWFYAFDRQPRP
jgi:pantoate--beta-alanine ligase